VGEQRVVAAVLPRVTSGGSLLMSAPLAFLASVEGRSKVGMTTMRFV